MKKNIIFSSIILFFIFIYLIPTFFGLLKFIKNTIESTNKTLIDGRIKLVNYKVQNFDPVILFTEQNEVTHTPIPYTGFRADPYRGELVNIEKQGQFTFRKSINHSINADVWFFGGSTMYGSGATDNTTIPSFYARITGQKVINFGVSAYNSRQELELMLSALLLLKKPKMVVFYDGYNDIETACSSNLEYIPQYYKTTEYFSKYTKKMTGEITNNNENPLFYFVKRPYMYLYERIFPKSYYRYELNEDSLCMSKEYLKNSAKSLVLSWQVADAILQKYDVDFFPVLQPTRFSTKSNLDHLPKENLIRKQFFQKAYDIILEEISQTHMKNNFISLTSVLNDALYYFTDPVHVSPNGNQKIAEYLSKRIN